MPPFYVVKLAKLRLKPPKETEKPDSFEGIRPFKTLVAARPSRRVALNFELVTRNL